MIADLAVNVAVEIAATNDDRPRGLGAKEDQECRQMVRCESLFEAEIRREREAREAMRTLRRTIARERAAALDADFSEWMTRDETQPPLTLPASVMLRPSDDPIVR